VIPKQKVHSRVEHKREVPAHFAQWAVEIVDAVIVWCIRLKTP
jgi:hypothetical protein